MRKVMSMMMVALFVAGASALACDTCGCKAKQEEKKSCCTQDKKCADCTAEKQCEACAAKCAEAKK